MLKIFLFSLFLSNFVFCEDYQVMPLPVEAIRAHSKLEDPKYSWNEYYDFGHFTSDNKGYLVRDLEVSAGSSNRVEKLKTRGGVS